MGLVRDIELWMDRKVLEGRHRRLIEIETE